MPNPFLRPHNQRKEADDARAQFTHPDGDHLTLLNLFHAWKTSASCWTPRNSVLEAETLGSAICTDPEPNWCWQNYVSHRAMLQADNVRNQLKRVMERFDLDLVSTAFDDKRYYTNIRMAITTGYFMQVGHREGEKGSYTTRDGQIVGLHPSCGLDNNPEWVVYNEVRQVALTGLVRESAQRYLVMHSSFLQLETSFGHVRRSSPNGALHLDGYRTVLTFLSGRLLDFAPAYYNLKEMPDGETKRALQRVVMKREGKLGGGGPGQDKRDKKRRKKEGR